MSFLSNRVNAIQPSPTLMIAAKAKELKAEGRNIISLSTGEPDFDTHLSIKEAAITAIRNGKTKYTAVDGIRELKEAIQSKFLKENDLSYGLDEITVNVGAKQTLFNALGATLNPGDEVIIPAPYWVSYVDMTVLFEGAPVIVPCGAEQGFKLTPDTLEAVITNRTKWLILNSPSNPTGAVYSRDELKALAHVLEKYPHVWTMSDDIYEHLIYDDSPFSTIASVAPALRDRTLTINGVSKAYAMTGWRIGYGGGPKQLIKAIEKIQSQSTSNPTTISQYAALGALMGDQSLLIENRAVFKRRRDMVISILSTVPGIKTILPPGAFYIFANCAGLIGKMTPQGALLDNDTAIAAYLLDHVGVSVVPGVAFGLSPYVRISYTAADDLLEDACLRIKKAVEDLERL